MYLKQSTTATINFSGVRSSLDGTTLISSVVTGDITVELYKNGVRSTVSRTITELADGSLSIALTAGDTDTLGRLEITIIDEDVFLTVSKEFMVMAAGVYESMFGGSPISNKVISAGYIDDFLEDVTITFFWKITGTASGDGTIRIYKNGLTDEVTIPTYITDTRNFDGITGLNVCQITTRSKDWYEKKSDYVVIISDETIDGEKVTDVIASLSIENRVLGEQFIRQG